MNQPSTTQSRLEAPTRSATRAERPRHSERVHTAFKTREVVDLLGLSRRQLQYWAKTGLVEPSQRTPGGHHRYSFDDLVALKATKRLIDAGVSVQKIRSSVETLRRLLLDVEHPLAELVLVATGDVILIFKNDTVFEAISGQEWIFEVAEFEQEVLAHRAGEPLTLERPGSAGQETPDTAQPGSPERPEWEGVLPAKPGPRSARPNGRRDGQSSLGRTG